MRTLRTIAREINADWSPVHYSAVPYLRAMATLETMADNYGLDSANEIVARFLGNAAQWKGTVARRVKLELKGMLKKAPARSQSTDWRTPAMGR